MRQCQKCGKHAYLRKGVCANPSCRKWFARLPGQGWWNQRGGGSSSSWEVPPVLPPPATPPILFPQPPAAPPPEYLIPGSCYDASCSCHPWSHGPCIQGNASDASSWPIGAYASRPAAPYAPAWTHCPMECACATTSQSPPCWWICSSDSSHGIPS